VDLSQCVIFRDDGLLASEKKIYFDWRDQGATVSRLHKLTTTTTTMQLFRSIIVSTFMVVCVLWILSTATMCQAFSVVDQQRIRSSLTPMIHRPPRANHSVQWNSESSDQEEPGKKKLSLEEKMKSWEASEEEIKAATLGGLVPQSKERTGAFDVGLYIAFPIMVITGLIFALFPFIMGSLDVDSVGLPPTV
jgi:hypothetical protein